MLFKPGDKVILNELKMEQHQNPLFVYEMHAFKGEELTIDRYERVRSYLKIKEDRGSWTWNENWFDLSDPFPIPSPKQYD